MTWFCATNLTSAALMVRHWVVLPQPDLTSEASRRALAALDPLRVSQPSWLAVHVLYAACPCSRKVVEHLLQQSPIDGIREVYLIAGTQPELELLLARSIWPVVRVSPQTLAQSYELSSVPALLVLDPQANLRYAGGYTDHKQGLAIHDREILRESQRIDSTQETLPIYGCGVGQELRNLLDPLSLQTGN